MAKRLHVALIATTVLILNLTALVGVVFPFETVGGYWISRPGSTVTVNATTPKTITCPYDLSELTIYSIGDYSFNFDSATLTTPNMANGDPIIVSGNFFTTGIRYRSGSIGRVIARTGTVTLRLFWTVLGK